MSRRRGRGTSLAGPNAPSTSPWRSVLVQHGRPAEYRWRRALPKTYSNVDLGNQGNPQSFNPTTLQDLPLEVTRADGTDTVLHNLSPFLCGRCSHGFGRLERAEAALAHCTGTLSPTEPAVEATWCHHLLGSNSASPAPSSTRRHAPPFWFFGQVA
eukprot:scaffold13124_cov70-Phaeocystis_antarctica.AAC.4